jgi:uncharacterized damage-inducible protein DinB
MAGIAKPTDSDTSQGMDMKQLISFAMILVAGTTTIAAQSAPPAADAGYTASVRASWNAIKRNVSRSAQAMPDEGFAFKPTPDVRSFGQLLGHLANEHYIFCSVMKSEKNPHEGVDFEKKTTKAEFVKDINDSIAYCDAAYAAMKDDAKLLAPLGPNQRDTLFGSALMNVTHDSEHYGNLVTYLRMKGIVPPSSQPSR